MNRDRESHDRENHHVDEALLARLSDCLAAQMGLYFPIERHADLQRGLGAVARHFGFADGAECARALVAAPLSRVQIEILAEHLTVGETYFFREKKTFEALEQHVLPTLIQERRQSGQKHLRLWSAGCCTGEEPYSLAIQLSRMLPDIADWRITILATDINPRFLQRAEAGVYGNWSFRATPPALRDQYFGRTADNRYQVLSKIRQMVKFAAFNLVEEETYAALNTNEMNMIFCRNVLIYLERDQAAKVIRNFHRALAEGGWYITSPSETSPLLSSQFEIVSFPGAFFYRKPSVEKVRLEKTVAPAAPPAQTRNATTKPSHPPKTSTRPKVETQKAEAPKTQLKQAEPIRGKETVFDAALKEARRAANRGDLEAALEACDRAIGADKLQAASHYLRAQILQEQGETMGAAAALKRALYLEPDFVLVHFALGNLARGENKFAEAARHFSHALALLSRYDSAAVLPESDGVTAGALTDVIAALTKNEKV